MKITIKPNPVMKLILNIEGFKKQLKEDLNLEAAFNNNIAVKKTEIDIKEGVEYAYLSINWGQIIKFINEGPKNLININLYSCDVEGFKTYKPGTIDNMSGEITYESHEQDLKDYFLVVHEFIPEINLHIETLLSNNLIDSSEEHKKIINL